MTEGHSLHNTNTIMHINNQLLSLLIDKELEILEVLIFILDSLSQLNKIYHKIRQNTMRSQLIIKKFRGIEQAIWILMWMAKITMIAHIKINLLAKMDKEHSLLKKQAKLIMLWWEPIMILIIIYHKIKHNLERKEKALKELSQTNLEAHSI